MIYIRDMCCVCVCVCVCGTARCNSWVRHLKAWVKGNHTLSNHAEWNHWNSHQMDYRITFPGTFYNFHLFLTNSEIMCSPESTTVCYRHLSVTVFGVLRSMIIKGYGTVLPSHGTIFTHVVMEHDKIFSSFNSITSTYRHKYGGVLTIFFPFSVK